MNRSIFQISLFLDVLIDFFILVLLNVVLLMLIFLFKYIYNLVKDFISYLNLIENSKFLFNVLKEDIKSNWFYIRGIFMYKNKIFILIFLGLIPIMFVYSVYAFLLGFVWYITFLVRHLVYVWSKTSIIVTCNVDIYHNVWLNCIMGEWSMGNFIGFLIDFLWYYPKLLAFNCYYNLFKAYYYNKTKVKQILLIFTILFPWRLLIKLITGFSYLSIKMAALFTTEIIDSYGCEWDWTLKSLYLTFIDGTLGAVNFGYFYDLLFFVKRYKIYIHPSTEIVVSFNPRWYDECFQNWPSLIKALYLNSNNRTFYWIKLIGTEKQDIKHPGIMFTKEFSDTKCVSIQSASRYTKIFNKDNTFYLYKGLIHEKKGVLNKLNLFDYQIMSSNKYENTILTNRLILKKIDYEQLKINNINFMKAFILSMFEKDLLLTKNGVEESKDYNLLIDRTIDMYNKNQLNDTYKNCFDAIFHFVDNNKIDLSSQEGLNKIILFNYIVSEINIYYENLYDLSHIEFNKLPLDVQKSLTNFNIKF